MRRERNHRRVPLADRSNPVPAAAAATFTATDWLLFGAIAAALLGTAWLVDPYAHEAFDAPKRLIAVLAAVVGGAALLWQTGPPRWRDWSRLGRAIAIAGLLGAVGLVVATAASPHPALSVSALRTMLLFGLFLPLGAARILGGPLGRHLLYAAGLAVAVNALLSLLQAGGVASPRSIARIGGRFPTGALLGNEGYVAVACALTGSACIALALNATHRRQRLVAIGLGALAVAAIALNQQATSAAALVAAALAIAAVRWRARWLVAFGAVLVLGAALAAAIAPVRDRTWARLPRTEVETLQEMTTYRLGAWAAANEMLIARPWTGHGPGAYAAQAQAHRLAAEQRLRARLLPPPTASSFVHAHQEYLQLAAEAGIPTLSALVASLAMLIAGLMRLARSPGACEPLAVLAVVVAGAVAALGWFPMQIPFTAVVLLLACGRGWRLIAESHEAGR